VPCLASDWWQRHVCRKACVYGPVTDQLQGTSAVEIVAALPQGCLLLLSSTGGKPLLSSNTPCFALHSLTHSLIHSLTHSLTDQVGYMGVPYNGSPMASHPQYITVRNSRGREMLDALGADLVRTPSVDTGDRRPLVMQVSGSTPPPEGSAGALVGGVLLLCRLTQPSDLI